MDFMRCLFNMCSRSDIKDVQLWGSLKSMLLVHKAPGSVSEDPLALVEHLQTVLSQTLEDETLRQKPDSEKTEQLNAFQRRPNERPRERPAAKPSRKLCG